MDLRSIACFPLQCNPRLAGFLSSPNYLRQLAQRSEKALFSGQQDNVISNTTAYSAHASRLGGMLHAQVLQKRTVGALQH